MGLRVQNTPFSGFIQLLTVPPTGPALTGCSTGCWTGAAPSGQPQDGHRSESGRMGYPQRGQFFSDTTASTSTSSLTVPERGLLSSGLTPRSTIEPTSGALHFEQRRLPSGFSQPQFLHLMATSLNNCISREYKKINSFLLSLPTK